MMVTTQHRQVTIARQSSLLFVCLGFLKEGMLLSVRTYMYWAYTLSPKHHMKPTDSRSSQKCCVCVYTISLSFLLPVLCSLTFLITQTKQKLQSNDLLFHSHSSNQTRPSYSQKYCFNFLKPDHCDKRITNKSKNTIGSPQKSTPGVAQYLATRHTNLKPHAG